ncbi:TetR/AcrR family transcriptional regulator [Nocardioides alkalitolerans]|uniref:TetR/AcrR family transcriptional regulator n=1 Tax=Nocardioides alkalitolerans TaxID=281714 RepID=UPI000425833C|nr:TetR/AcrR family transcriptional regulator [Nocardioides alkalitolerans]
MPDVDGTGKPVVGSPRRKYDAPRRREQAARTREAVHSAAFELFSAHGYTRTTLADVARAAGVSVETVQKYGPKAQLLDGARRMGVLGSMDLASILDAPVMEAVLAADDLAGAVDALVEFYSVNTRLTAGFWRAWKAATNVDPVVNELWEREIRSGRAAFRTGVEVVRPRGWLRTDVDDHELAATLWLLVSVETYTRMTVDAGLDEQSFRNWLRRSLMEQLGGLSR